MTEVYSFSVPRKNRDVAQKLASFKQWGDRTKYIILALEHFDYCRTDCKDEECPQNCEDTAVDKLEGAHSLSNMALEEFLIQLERELKERKEAQEAEEAKAGKKLSEMLELSKVDKV